MCMIGYDRDAHAHDVIERYCSDTVKGHIELGRHSSLREQSIGSHCDVSNQSDKYSAW